MYISINAIESESKILERDLRFFSFRKIVLKFVVQFLEGVFNRLRTKLIADLDRSLLALNGAFTVIESYTPEQAGSELGIVKKVIQIYRRSNNRMMEVNYFGSMEIESKVKECISLLEDIDIQLRKKVHSKRVHENTPDELLTALTKQSMSAISQSLSR